MKRCVAWLAGALIAVATAVRAAEGGPPSSGPPDPASAASASAAPAPPAAARRAPGAVLDRLELESTQITGNKELPKVMYVVPWRRPDLGDLAGKPPNSILDELLAPVDRDVFRRQNRYFAALQPDARGGAPAAEPASVSGDPSPAAAKDEKKDEK